MAHDVIHYRLLVTNGDSIQPEFPGAVSIRPLSEEIDLTLKRILRFLFNQMRKVVWAAVVLENPLGNGEMSAVFSPEPFSLQLNGGKRP